MLPAARRQATIRRASSPFAIYWQNASMPTPEEYRKTAEAYYRLALEAKTEADRLALLKLAEHWLEAASREDNKTSEQAAATQKPTP